MIKVKSRFLIWVILCVIAMWIMAYTENERQPNIHPVRFRFLGIIISPSESENRAKTESIHSCINLNFKFKYHRIQGLQVLIFFAALSGNYSFKFFFILLIYLSEVCLSCHVLSCLPGSLDLRSVQSHIK